MRPVELSDVDDEENTRNDEEDKILERIHHDLNENMLIEKLVGALQNAAVASSSSWSSSEEQDIEKRYGTSLYNEPFSTSNLLDRQMSQFKYQIGSSTKIKFK